MHRYLLVALFALAGCSPSAPDGGCATSADCRGSGVCIDRRCVSVDASVPDAPPAIDSGPITCAAPCEGDTHCVAGVCERYRDGEILPACNAPPRPFAVAPRALCHWPTPGVDLTEGPVEWRWARRIASTVVAGTFLPPTGEFDVPPTWLVFATGTVSSGATEEPARWNSGGVLRVLDPQTCTLVDTLDEVPVAAWFQPAAIGDLDDDGTPEIVAQAWAGDVSSPAPAYQSSGPLVAWRWDPALSRFRVWRRATVSGAPEADLAYTAGYTVMAGPTIADLDDDGVPEVIQSGRVYDHELRRLTGEAPPITPIFMSRQPPGGPFIIQEDVVADLDRDGRAELVLGDSIWSWTGTAWERPLFFTPPPLGTAHAVVADFGELPASVDGAPEIVAVGYDGVRIQSIAGTVLRRFDLLTGDRGGSAPSIANVDDDPEPEILVGVDAGLFVYDLECDADPTPAGCGIDASPRAGLPPLPRGVRWADRPPLDAWDYMGATTFDFDADGDVEVVYADECFLRVYDGATGAVLYSHWRPSRTASEVPIVVGTGDGADTVIAIGLHTARFCTQATGVGGVPPYDPQFPGLSCASDLDCFGPAGSCRAGRCRCTMDAECCAPGTADCVATGFACHPSEDTDGNTCRAVRVPDASGFATFGALEEGLDVLTDAFGRWAPARPVWNQDAYAITNVGDDGFIPRTSEVVPSWAPEGHGTFRSNIAGPGGSAAAADLRVATLPCQPFAGDTTLLAEICNRGHRGAPAGQRVTFTDATSSALLCEALTTEAIAPGTCVDATCALAAPLAASGVLIAVAEDGRLPECGGADGNVLDAPVYLGCE